MYRRQKGGGPAKGTGDTPVVFDSEQESAADSLAASFLSGLLILFEIERVLPRRFIHGDGRDSAGCREGIAL